MQKICMMWSLSLGNLTSQLRAFHASMLLLIPFETLHMNIMAIIDSTSPEQAYNNEAPTYQELNFLIYLLNMVDYNIYGALALSPMVWEVLLYMSCFCCLMNKETAFSL